MSRFSKGAFRFLGTIFLVVFLQMKFDITHLQHVLSNELTILLGSDLSALLLLAFYLFVLYCFFYLIITGAYFMAAWEHPIDFFESKTKGKELSVYGNPNYENINRILKYREEKMGLMTNEERVRFVMDTSKLDNLYSSSGGYTRKTLEYINGRLGLMSNEAGIDYLQNGIK